MRASLLLSFCFSFFRMHITMSFTTLKLERLLKEVLLIFHLWLYIISNHRDRRILAMNTIHLQTTDHDVAMSWWTHHLSLWYLNHRGGRLTHMTVACEDNQSKTKNITYWVFLHTFKHYGMQFFLPFWI